jgi:hypothetical protein
MHDENQSVLMKMMSILPKASAATRCRSGQADDVNENTAGAERTTESP